jgi:hypothetical protein
LRRTLKVRLHFILFADLLEEEGELKATPPPPKASATVPSKKRGRPLGSKNKYRPKKQQKVGEGEVPAVPRKRNPNWTVEQDVALLRLVKKHDKNWDETHRQFLKAQHTRTWETASTLNAHYRSLIGTPSTFDKLF